MTGKPRELKVLQRFRREYEEGLRAGEANREYLLVLAETGDRQTAERARWMVLQDILPIDAQEGVGDPVEPPPWGFIGNDRKIVD